MYCGRSRNCSTSILLKESSRLLLHRIIKRHHHFPVIESPISSADFPLQSGSKYFVTVSLSVSPDVMLAYCMLKIYVPGGVRAEGLPYHVDDGSFVLGAIPEDEASGGRTVGHRNPKYVTLHKGQSVWWSWAEWAVVLVENKREPFISYPSVTVWISHKPFAGIQAMANDGLWCRFHLTELTAELMSVSLWSRQTKRQTRLFLRLWDEWCFPSSLWGDCWSKILCSSIVSDSRDSVALGVLQAIKW